MKVSKNNKSIGFDEVQFIEPAGQRAKLGIPRHIGGMAGVEVVPAHGDEHEIGFKLEYVVDESLPSMPAFTTSTCGELFFKNCSWSCAG